MQPHDPGLARAALPQWKSTTGHNQQLGSPQAALSPPAKASRPCNNGPQSILGVELSPAELASLNPTFLGSQKFRVSASGLDGELKRKQENHQLRGQGGSPNLLSHTYHPRKLSFESLP